MAFCRNCGSEIDERAKFCPKCGANQGIGQVPYEAADNGGIGWGVLGFCLPMVGLVLYLVWKDTKPITSRMLGKGALISVIVIAVFYVLMILLGSCAALML